MSKAERTRQFIIEKTAPVFNTKGYAGTSLSDMMDVTGLTKGSIYGNFENKDEVALAAFDFNFQRVVSYLRDRMEERDSVIGKLLVYPETYRNFPKLSFLRSGCPVMNTSTEADDTHPLLREKAANALQYWKSALERHLRSGIEKKEIKAGTDIHEFTSVMIALIQGSVMHAKVTGKTALLNTSMDYLEKMIKALRK